MNALLFFLFLLFAVGPAHGVQQAQRGYRISGVVIDSVTSAPVVRAEVSLHLDTEETKTTTRDDGRFVFQGVEAGKYRLDATAQGYVREGLNQHGVFFTGIAVGSGLDSEHVIFRLHRQAVITGKVTDEHEEAFRHAQVMLFNMENANGGHGRSVQAQSQTDDLGEYRFAHLPPGKYCVAVNARPWYAEPGLSYLPDPNPEQGTIASFRRINRKPDPLLDVVYPITFYPGVTNENAAGELHLAAGDKVVANIKLQALPAVHVRLTNLPVDEKSGVNVDASRKLFGSLVAPLNAVAAQISPGEYEVAGLPPGDVSLIVNQHADQGWTSRIIKANVSGGEALDGSETDATANISGRMIFSVGDPDPVEGQVTLLSEDNQNASAALQKDGTFSFSPLRAGTYKVGVNRSGRNEYVEHISATGAKTFGREIAISGAGDVQLSITMGQGVGQVAGVAKLDGKPIAGVMVLLVSESGQNLEEDSRMDQSDSDGTFGLNGIVPGKYLLVAIEDGWDLDWTNWGALKPYLEKGQALQISVDDKKNVEVMVQHKK